MRLFVDTNVLLELILGRNNANDVRTFFDFVTKRNYQVFISSSSLCTISYYVEAKLKESGIHKPEKTEKARNILNQVLQIVTITDVTHAEALAGINDSSFDDFEDSLQYQCAKRAKCEVIITYNTRDYKNVDSDSISVLLPQDFLNSQ